jgi:hypothetical protein
VVVLLSRRRRRGFWCARGLHNDRDWAMGGRGGNLINMWRRRESQHSMAKPSSDRFHMQVCGNKPDIMVRAAEMINNECSVVGANEGP